MYIANDILKHLTDTSSELYTFLCLFKKGELLQYRRNILQFKYDTHIWIQ